MSMVAPELVKDFKPNIAQIFLTVAPQTDVGFEGHRFQGQGHRKHFRKMHL